MAIWVDHCAANIDSDWLDYPLVPEMDVDEDKPSIFFSFTTDYGKGERLFKFIIEANSFAQISAAMMQIDPVTATAAFVAALSKQYPISSVDED